MSNNRVKALIESSGNSYLT